MEKVRTIHLQGGFNEECFLIHGYTGSPRDFNELPEYLHQKSQMDIKAILLRGHGKHVEALEGLEWEDFLIEIENELKKDLKQYERVTLGGISFGAQLALYLGAHYPVKRIFNVCIPYQLKFPFNIPGLSGLKLFKKYWYKPRTPEEIWLRKKHFYCPEMPIEALKIIKQGNKNLNSTLERLKCPILSIHSKYDPIGYHKALRAMEVKGGRTHEKKIFDIKNHNLFFTQKRFDVYKSIHEFVSQKPIYKDDKNNIAAIVPAYNEERHVGQVLNVLRKTKLFQEIVAVDDASTDHTFEVINQFHDVKCIRNKRNRGKAYSLQRAIEATTANILFFCDADLEGLTPKIVSQIIKPVTQGQYEMYIGIRNNKMQKAVHLFAINSGERALTRDLWNNVSKHFKFRYRIEAGLNFTAKMQIKGYGWRQFNYYQTLKEKKYGFIKGTFLRWWMNLDVGYAYLLSFLLNQKKH